MSQSHVEPLSGLREPGAMNDALRVVPEPQSQTSELIRWFDEIGQSDTKVVGGKGGNLGELTRAGLPVPQGFAITSDAFIRALNADAVLATRRVIAAAEQRLLLQAARSPRP